MVAKKGLCEGEWMKMHQELQNSRLGGSKWDEVASYGPIWIPNGWVAKQRQRFRQTRNPRKVGLV
jgi:hypothetical protein